MKHLFLLPLLILFFACGQKTTTVIETECFQLPVGTHLPRLAKSDTSLWLSYVHSPEVGHDTLTIVYWEKEKWIGQDNIAHGDNWFINWADFPSAVPVDSYRDQSYYFYHWLQYSGEGTYDYDIMYNKQGWSEMSFPGKLHQDTVSAEHGFLSSAELTNGDLQVSWLDGRYTKQVGADAGAMSPNRASGAVPEGEVEAQGDEHGHGGGGAMTLRTKALTDSVSVELDHRVCDCCNTATVATDDLVMVAYRDRSEHEIRDIGYVIKPTGGEWSTPKLVHADNWEISGCPVNGPALAANGAGNIALVWYTAPADRAQILFSRYLIATDSWQPPTLLDDTSPLGRVDIQLAEDGTAYATALTTKEGTEDAFLTLWTISPSGEVQREDLVTTSPARSSGFPKIALFEGKLYWTRTVVGETKIDHHVEVCWKAMP